MLGLPALGVYVLFVPCPTHHAQSERVCGGGCEVSALDLGLEYLMQEQQTIFTTDTALLCMYGHLVRFMNILLAWTELLHACMQSNKVIPLRLYRH